MLLETDAPYLAPHPFRGRRGAGTGARRGLRSGVAGLRGALRALVTDFTWVDGDRSSIRDRGLSVTVGGSPAPMRPAIVRVPDGRSRVPVHTDRRRHRRSERGRLTAQALVLALVVAGTTAFATLQKTVTIDVDGELSTVTAFGRTVDSSPS